MVENVQYFQGPKGPETDNVGKLAFRSRFLNQERSFTRTDVGASSLFVEWQIYR